MKGMYVLIVDIQIIKMVMKKIKGGWVIMHCHNGRNSRIDATKKPVTYKKALSIHRAIMISKHGGKKK